MRPDLAPAIAAARARLSRAAAALRRHRSGLELAVPAALALAGGVLVGQTALGRAAEYGDAAERTLAVWDRTRRWTDSFRPASPAEERAWAESEQAAASYTPQRLDALGTASLVAARAEEVGVRDVRIRLEPTDTLQLPDALAVGPWRLEPGTAAISAELRTDLDGLVAFLGVLPPHVSATRIVLDPAGGTSRARVLLVLQQMRIDP